MFQGQKPQATMRLLIVPPNLRNKSSNSSIYDIMGFFANARAMSKYQAAEVMIVKDSHAEQTNNYEGARKYSVYQVFIQGWKQQS
jgi:hypothetical protein